MTRCKHRGTQGLTWGYGNWMIGGDDARRCRNCGTWLPLGPARDTPATAIEVRAAEIAQAATDDEWYLRKLEQGTEPSDHGWGWFFADRERVSGSRAPEFTPEGRAGYLARCIHFHPAGDEHE